MRLLCFIVVADMKFNESMKKRPSPSRPEFNIFWVSVVDRMFLNSLQFFVVALHDSVLNLVTRPLALSLSDIGNINTAWKLF